MLHFLLNTKIIKERNKEYHNNFTIITDAIKSR